jgi:hypothetical protein
MMFTAPAGPFECPGVVAGSVIPPPAISEEGGLSVGSIYVTPMFRRLFQQN